MATTAFYSEVRVVIAQAYRTMCSTLDESEPVKHRDAHPSSGQTTPSELELNADEVKRKAVYSLFLAGSWR
jgi:hypothetical protein